MRKGVGLGGKKSKRSKARRSKARRSKPFAVKALARRGGRTRVPGLHYSLASRLRAAAVTYSKTLPTRSTVRLAGRLTDAEGLRVVANRTVRRGDALCRYIVPPPHEFMPPHNFSRRCEG